MKSFKKKKWIISCILIGIMLCIFYMPIGKSLVFYQAKSNKIIGYLPVASGDKFAMVFTHSIHLTDVIEKFEVMADGRMRAYEMVFEQFGIGMPENSGPGERFLYEDGKYYIKDMDRLHDSLNIRNGKTVSENRFTWGDYLEEEVYLNDYMEPGTSFTLIVERLTIWEQWRGVKIHAG